MPHVLTKTVYNFDELSESAKEKAREWFRTDDDFDGDCTIEDAAICGEIIGIDLRTRAVKLMGGGTRMEPCVYWSGFWSQGDGACFEGTYKYAKGASKKIREHAPQDTELHRIADELQKVQQQYFYGIEATTRQDGRYFNMEFSVTVERDNAASIADAEEKIPELLRDFANWIYRQLEREYEYCNSDDVVDDNIRANEYEFDENGNRAR